MLTRRSFAASAGAIATAALLDSRSSLGDITPSGGHLLIPQLIDAASQNNVVKLTVSSGHHAFYKGKPTRTFGCSAPILGPVLRFRRGDRVEMIFQNAIDAPTTVHWHGLLVPGDADGGPRQRIDPGSTWRPILAVDQPAVTLWYHPHPHQDTARQIYLGLAGLIIVDDGNDLSLPHQFGVDDLPLTIQDRSLDDDGSLTYDPEQFGVVYGVRGDVHCQRGGHAYRQRSGGMGPPAARECC